jgi:hypothetical protein
MKKYIYFFVSRAVVFNDKIIPVMLELSRQGNPVRSVFLDRKAVRFYHLMPTYARWLDEHTDVDFVAPRDAQSPLYRLRGAFNLLWLMLGMLVRRDYLAFFDAKKAGWVTWLLTVIGKLRGKVIIYAGAYCEIHPGYDWRPDEEKYKAEMHKSPTSERQASYRKRERKKHAHEVLLFNHDQYDEFKLQDCPYYRLLPFPKMQKWWADFMAAYPPYYDHDLVAQSKDLISIFVTFRGNYLMDPKSDIDVLLPDMIRAVREVYPHNILAIKPKESASSGDVKGIIEATGEKNFFITQTPVSLLALKSIFGMATCHTTAQQEFMCHTPLWIEYCRYSEFWKGIYPRMTFTEVYGGLFEQYYDGLLEAVRGIESRQYALEEFKKLMDFREQPLSVEFFYNSPTYSERVGGGHAS